MNPNLLGSLRALAAPLFVLGLAVVPAFGQTTFSIDYKSATISSLDTLTATAITEGDLLSPTTGIAKVGAQPTPNILITGGAGGLGLALHPVAVGHAPGVPGMVEVDALSYGIDAAVTQSTMAGKYRFSVDKYALGTNTPIAPHVFGEGSGGAQEACADVFIDLGLPTQPVCPPAATPGHTGEIDGDGQASTSGAVYRGLGLIEPNPVVPTNPPADDGDTLDALDEDGPIRPTRYFSLDSAFIDPITGLPNSGSAFAHGFVGGDVLVVSAGGVPVVYATAVALGLDSFGADTDDLDALVLLENGVPGYQPSTSPFDWLAGTSDMLLFSLRRGSATIANGVLDSICGVPIEPGDILTAPVVVGGAPGIFICAETIGLLTARSHMEPFGDDLDALDHFECESDFLVYCTGKTTSQGCVPFIYSGGVPSATSTNPFNLRGEDHVANQGGIAIYGYQKANINFHGGKLCVKAPFRRTPGKIAKSKASGTCASGVNPTGRLNRDFNNTIQTGADPMLTPGQRVFAQWFQRDPGNTTGGVGDNFSNGIRFTICP